jgi:hypothetical protein
MMAVLITFKSISCHDHDEPLSHKNASEVKQVKTNDVEEDGAILFDLKDKISNFYNLWPKPLFLLATHKQCILSHFIHNSTAMFP